MEIKAGSQMLTNYGVAQPKITGTQGTVESHSPVKSENPKTLESQGSDQGRLHQGQPRARGWHGEFNLWF